MKKVIAMLLALSLFFTGCGNSAREMEMAQPDSGTQRSFVESSNAQGSTEVSEIDMLYYKKLSDSAIMAACYTEEGIAQLGNDYYVIHVGDAKIYDAEGATITLEELTRGCPIRVQWPGMVMESYPGQISADVVAACSDTPHPAVPPEDEIQPVGNGPKWWVEDPITEVPPLRVEYRTEEGVYTMLIPHHNGSWSYAEEHENSGSGSLSSNKLDGQHPRAWHYDDDNTVKRSGFDRLRLSASPEPQTMEVIAFPVEPADGQKDELQAELDEEGNLALLDGDCIYVVKAAWDEDTYQGQALYGFMVMEP